MTCEFDCLSPVIPLYSDMARALYRATAATETFQFAFDYLDKAQFGTSSFSGYNSSTGATGPGRYVRVFVGNDKDDVSERTDFTVPSASSVRLTGLVAGQYVLIIRDDKPSEQMVDFTDPNVTSADLDLGYRHVLFNVQTLFDRLKDVNCRLDDLCGSSNAGNGGPSYQFNGDCSGTSYALNNDHYGAQSELGVEDVLVFINGILQPYTSFTIDNSSGTSTVVLDTVATNTDVIYVKVISNARIAYRVIESGIADGAITTNKLANGAVTPAKMGFGSYGTIRQVWANQDGTNWGNTTLTPTFISGFDTQVRASRLDQMAVPTGSVSLNNQKITNLANGASSGDAVNKGQLDANNANITAIQHSIAGGYNQGYAGIMPDLYYRASYMTNRDAAWAAFYPGVVPQVATTSTRHATQKLMTGFVPRRIKLLLSGAIRRNASSTVIHGATSFTRTFDFIRWDDDNWFTCPNSGVYDGQYKTYTLLPQSTTTGDNLALTNITFTLECDFTNSNTWLYIYGSGFGSELMRLTSPSDSNTVGVIQIVAERGY